MWAFISEMGQRGCPRFLFVQLSFNSYLLIFEEMKNLKYLTTFSAGKLDKNLIDMTKEIFLS